MKLTLIILGVILLGIGIQTFIYALFSQLTAAIRDDYYEDERALRSLIIIIGAILLTISIYV